MSSDGELLRGYVEANAEEAFAELVQRHLNLVYSAALRQVNGDAHLAKDVTQTVFTDLARKAAKLSRRPLLAGWLYTSTHFAAAKAVRTEHRRLAREQEAYIMNQLLESAAPGFDWEKLQPLLDAGMHELKEADREIILLRFFENRPLRDIGEALDLSEDAARKRIERALEKLRLVLSRKGIGSGVTLGAMLSAHAVQVAPGGLGPILTHTAMASAVTASKTTFTLFKMMTMTKVQTGLAGGLIIAGFLTPLIIQQHSLAGQRHQLDLLKSQASEMAEMQAENQRLSKLPTPAAPVLSPDQFTELLKLRGEVGVQQRRLAKLELERMAREDSATAMALRAPATTNYFPKTAWANAGNSTPEAALQSSSWAIEQALKQGDLKALLAVAGPDAQAKAAQEFAGKSDSEIQAELASYAADAAKLNTKEAGFRIINRQVISADQVVLTFYIDGADAFGMMPFKQNGNGWQVSNMPKSK